MKKEILTIGYEIPGFSELWKEFTLKTSFMDADIVVISPEFASLSYVNWINFTTGGGGCYNISASKSFNLKLERLSREVNDSLKAGKSIFILLADKKEYELAAGSTSPRKGEHNFTTITKTNYDFLPINIGDITSASGKHISFSGNPIFSEFHKLFKSDMEYQCYIENSKTAQVLYTGKDKTKILGAIFQVEKGNLIMLPYIDHEVKAFQEYNEKKDETYWNDEAVEFGVNFTNCLIKIDQQLNQKSEKTPIPAWVLEQKYTLKKATLKQKLILNNEQKIEQLKSKIEILNAELEEENIFRDLLFETGKLLENAVTKALRVLGYKAENYDDGVLELDQIIISPEKHRFIGECEGKDNKDINITKFRQLLESLNADFARDEVEEKAYGILFGNPQRLEVPNKRKLDFTKKCKIGAEREKIALIKTPDLFEVVKYLAENKNSNFKKECRNAIYNGLGKVVKFPSIPKNE